MLPAGRPKDVTFARWPGPPARGRCHVACSSVRVRASAIVVCALLDGWQFRTEQRRTPGWAQIPVVVVSGDSDIASKAEALHVAGFLKKPTNAEDLLAAVATFSRVQVAS